MKSKKIWFVTRSYPPSKGGGAFVRKQQVDHFKKKGFDVTVLTTDLVNPLQEEDEVISIPIGFSLKILIYLERLLLLSCYLNFWSKSVEDFVSTNAKEGDIIFVTTGGELGFLQRVNSLKRKRSDVNIVINYHDFLVYAKYKGEKTLKILHKNVDHIEEEALESADLILTQSFVMKSILSEKYPGIAKKIDYFHFGFKESVTSKKERLSGDKIVIGYVGTMGRLQSPEMILDSLSYLTKNQISKIEIIFIGDYHVNPRINNSGAVKKIEYLPRTEMLKLLVEKIDIAFFSAIEEPALLALMPTKFYEYIGLEIPVLAAIPLESEAAKIINNTSIGLCSAHSDPQALAKNIASLISEPDILSLMKRNLKENKSKFNSEYTLNKMTCSVSSLFVDQ